MPIWMMTRTHTGVPMPTFEYANIAEAMRIVPGMSSVRGPLAS